MKLSPLDALRLGLEGIWITKAPYEDAEREFHIAVQKQREDGMSTAVPMKRKRNSKPKKNKSTANQDKRIDVSLEALRYEAQHWFLNPTPYADAERFIYEQKLLLAEASRLTPYQGSRRCFGKFKCKTCNWKWSSGYSWANISQQCQRCERKAYPYKQLKLDKMIRPYDDRSMVKEHDKTKCEKCKRIRGDCRNPFFLLNNNHGGPKWIKQ